MLTLGLIMISMFTSKPILRFMYPLHYQTIIHEQAAIYELDPFMIAAIIRVESGWRVDARSPKGATGLMQLMPETAVWIAGQLEIEFDVDTQLTDPEINIMLGAWYINHLRKQFPTFVAALAAYNGGQGNVRKWLDGDRWDGSLDNSEQIPFYETRAYVQKVTYIWNFYRHIYEYKWENGEGNL